MNETRLHQLINNPDKTQQELETLNRNALAKKELELAHLIQRKLDERFPGWDQVSGRGGSKTTKVRFGQERKQFPSSKKAFIWLIEQFSSLMPQLFTLVDWETEFIAKGSKRLYLGKSPEKLFFGTPQLAHDANNYHQLTNGWYLNVNLNNDQKLDILMRFSVLAQLEYDRDWHWQVLD